MKMLTFMKKNKFIILPLILLIGFIIFRICVDGNIGLAEESDMIKNTITVNNQSRDYFVYLPQSYKKEEKKFPAALVFHGTLADANKIKNSIKFNIFAEKNNVIAVYPEDSNGYDWDLKDGLKSKDIEYVSRLIDDAAQKYKIDRNRIYSTGFSSGAELTYILACSLSDKIAAFAPVGGNMREKVQKGCIIKDIAPVLVVQGTKDPYEKWGGDSNKKIMAVNQIIKFWENKNKCSNSRKEHIYLHKNNQDNSTTATLYSNNSCKNNSEVSLLEIDGGGHTWPGSPSSLRIEAFLGKTNYDIDGNEVIWEFFKRHELNSSGKI
jgi:polyhydroxybutyrate depolymerase